MKKAFEINDLGAASVPAPLGHVKQIFSIVITTLINRVYFKNSFKIKDLANTIPGALRRPVVVQL